MQYYVDGKIFSTEEEALRYEQEAKAKKAEQKKKADEKDADYKRVVDAYNNYTKLAEEFDKKYHTNVYSLNEIFKDLFNI